MATAAASGSGRKRKLDVDDHSVMEFDTAQGVEVIPTFDEMGLNKDLLRGIQSCGFEKPSALQQRSIRPIVKGKDLIVQ